MADLKDMLAAIINKEPVAYSTAFDEIMHERIADKIDEKRIDIAQNIYTESVDDDEDLDDFDFDDEDLDDEDLDFDFDDEDLDDFDFDDEEAGDETDDDED